MLRQIFEADENGKDVNELMEKAQHFDLLLQYVLELEGYNEKYPEALRKGVEYWRKKKTESDLDSAGIIKYLQVI